MAWREPSRGLVADAAVDSPCCSLADPAGLHPAAVAYVPGQLTSRPGSATRWWPGIKLWALAHLLANGNLADLLLFGAFLAWAVASFASARRRDRAAGRPTPLRAGLASDRGGGIGTLAWAGFAFWGHAWLIGVAPFAR
jgi:uncharacterized membrane protein